MATEERQYVIQTKEHGTIRLKGKNEADIRAQCKDLTYGPTTVLRIQTESDIEGRKRPIEI